MAHMQHQYRQQGGQEYQNTQGWQGQTGEHQYQSHHAAWPEGHSTNGAYGYGSQPPVNGHARQYAPGPGNHSRPPPQRPGADGYGEYHQGSYDGPYQNGYGPAEQEWQQQHENQYPSNGNYARPYQNGTAPRRRQTPPEGPQHGGSTNGYRPPVDGGGYPTMDARGGQGRLPAAAAQARIIQPPLKSVPPKQQRTGPRPPSPELMSWDNPFPVFPGAKKKNTDHGQRGLNHMVSNMTLQDKPNRPERPLETAPSDPGGGWASQDSNRSRPQYVDNLAYQGGPRNNGPRPVDTSVPNFSSRRPYRNPDQPQQDQVLQQDPQRPSGPPLALDTQQSLRNPTHGGYQSNPSSAPPVSSSRHAYGPRPELGGSDFPSRTSSNNHAGHQYQGASGAGVPSSYAQAPPHGQRRPSEQTAAVSDRPVMAPRARSDEAALVQHPPQYNAASTHPPDDRHTHNQSLGTFIETYYEPSPQYHELPSGTPPPPPPQPPHKHHQKPSEEDMPNFDAAPSGPIDHRRGMSIMGHLPQAKDITAAAAQHPIPELPGSQAEHGPSTTFAAQAHRTRSQPNLRSGGTSSPGGRDQGQVFEMAGDIPTVPVIPTEQQQPAYTHPYNRPTYTPDPHRYQSPSQQYRADPRHHPSNPAYDQSGYRQQSPAQARGYPNPNSYPNLNPYPNHVQRTASAHDTPRPSSESDRVRTSNSGQRPVDNNAAPRPFNPDALPAHPTPVRPGLSSSSTTTAQPSKPPPVRQYNHTSSSAPPTMDAIATPPPSSGGGGERRQSVPVTHAELQNLQQAIKANPNDRKTQLVLAKKLAEASIILADNGGRADPKTRNRNRERYAMDALKMVKKLVNTGDPDAIFYLADCYGTGRIGLEVDPKEAFSLYQSAAKGGHAQSAYRAAVCCEMGLEGGGGTRKDPMRAIQWYTKAASLGDTPAMYKLGMILLKGLLGQPKNPRDAMTWLRRAADRADEENPHALHELALLYENGNPNDNIPRDPTRSLELFKQAASLGYKFSQYRLGSAFEYGLMDCPIDPRRSIAWYSRAAVQGEHQSELALSGWYLTGSEGVLQQSDTEAYLWARRAAQSGLAKAEYAMGYFTEVGIGAPANLEEAKRWYRRASGEFLFS
ncbi:MAG: hypothetical protein M1823_004342 [Watsoniomyces obsoletus]|nr:MAG: hypothetical protein M1823_004342 [Watsoniomyces obsoletus]